MGVCASKESSAKHTAMTATSTLPVSHSKETTHLQKQSKQSKQANQSKQSTHLTEAKLSIPQTKRAKSQLKSETRRLGDSTTNTTTPPTTTQDNTLSARELAARAAEQRHLNQKSKNTGKLSQKLDDERKKTSVQHALDNYNEKQG